MDAAGESAAKAQEALDKLATGKAAGQKPPSVAGQADLGILSSIAENKRSSLSEYVKAEAAVKIASQNRDPTALRKSLAAKEDARPKAEEELRVLGFKLPAAYLDLH